MAKKINGNAHKIDIWYKVSLNLVQLGEGLMLLVNLSHCFAKSRKCHVVRYPGCQRSSRSPATRSIESEVCWSHFHGFVAQFRRPQREKKISGTQGSCKSDIFKLKFAQRSFVRLECIALRIGVHLKNAPNFANK